MDLTGIRYAIQWASAVLANIYFGFLGTKQVYQGALKSACVPFLNCHSCPSALFSCPVGTIQHFMTIHKFPYLVTSFLAFVGLSTGSMACGWLCPFGLLQDIMHKIKSVKIRVPEKLTGMRYLVLLFLVILLPYITQETWFSKLCPMGTLQAALPWAVWNPIIPVYGEPAVAVGTLGILFGVKIVILLSFLGLFVLAKRPFCRLICPLGAILGFFNRYSFIGIKVDKKDCAGCHSCREKCPVDINVGDDPAASTCVRCFECLDCPNVSVSAGTREIARSGVNEGKANG